MTSRPGPEGTHARLVHALGGRIVEVPIRFRDRVHGVSKMSRSIVLEAMLRVTQWGVQRRLGRRTRP